MINRLILVISALIILSLVGYAQKRSLLQTDYKDINHRQLIDRTFKANIVILDRQTQADTLVLTVGNTIDTIYLDNKYSDKAFVILLCDRDRLGSIVSREVCPLSDSSFVINKGTDDSSVVQWMTIKK